MKNSIQSASATARRNSACAFVAILLAGIVNTEAQLSWGVGGAGGSGTWDSVTPDWSDGTANVPWVSNGAGVFGGVAGTVSISTYVIATAVTFGTSGYVVQGGAIYGPAGGLTMRTDADATVNARIGSVGAIFFTKTGSATLTTTDSLSTFGRVMVADGELNVTSIGVGAPKTVFALADTGGAVITLGNLGGGAYEWGGLAGGGIVRVGAGTGPKTLVISGVGGSFGGSFRDSGATSLALFKSGSGIQELTGESAYTGPTTIIGGTLALAGGGSALQTAITVNGGTLLLDNSTTALADRVSDTAPMRLSGAIVFKGHTAVPSAERMGALLMTSAASVAVNPDPAQPAALTFASLSARSYGTDIITFSGARLGEVPGPGVASIRFGTAPVLVGGSYLHPEAYILPGALGSGASGSSFVTYGADGVRPLADAEYAGSLSGISSWENASIHTAQNISSKTEVNALRLQNGVAIANADTGYFSVGSGAILVQPGSASIVGGTMDLGAREAVIVTEGDLTIGSHLNVGSVLTKSGMGRLTLTGTNTLAGPAAVLAGILRLQNSAALGTTPKSVRVLEGAALELAGGITLSGDWSIYGNGPDGRGGLRSLGGDNRFRGTVILNPRSPTIEVASGSLTLDTVSGTLLKTGPGTLTVTQSLGSKAEICKVVGGALVLTMPGGSPLGSSPVTLNGSTLSFAPALSKPGAILALTSPGALTYQGGASTLALSKGANAAVTLTIGPAAFVRSGPATLLLAPGGGRAALGVTETVRLNSTANTAFPTVNGIVTPAILGQDTDAAHSGDFLAYTAATGLKPATYATSTSLSTVGSTAVFNATTPQTLTANAAVYALKNSGQTIDLGTSTLTIGATATPVSGLILNGGSIANGQLELGSAIKSVIYTSLAGGSISSVILGYNSESPALIKFGPGTLTLSGSVRRGLIVEAGGLKLDGARTQFTGPVAGNVTLARGTTLSGTGRVTGTVVGGLISPGSRAGILTAASTGPADTTLSGLAESFAPTAYAFEFTRLGAPIFTANDASGNDLLRLTSATAPFASPLTAADEIDLYFSQLDGGPRPGDILRGGFFTDRAAPFLSAIDQATYRYFLPDSAGVTVFNATTYAEHSELSVAVDTVPQTALLNGVTVNGYITEFRIVPEPATPLLLLAATLALGAKRRRTFQS